MRIVGTCRYLGQPLSEGDVAVLGAAPRSLRISALAAVGVTVLVTAASGSGRTPLPGVWALQLPTAKRTAISNSVLADFRRGGVSVLVVTRSSWDSAAYRRLVATAGNSNTRLVEPLRAPLRTPVLSNLRARCANPDRRLLDGCAVATTSVVSARAWLSAASVDFVVLHIGSAKAFDRLRLPSG